MADGCPSGGKHAAAHLLHPRTFSTNIHLIHDCNVLLSTCLSPLFPFHVCLNLIILPDQSPPPNLPFTCSASLSLHHSTCSQHSLGPPLHSFLQASFTLKNEGPGFSPVPETSPPPHLSSSRPVSHSSLADTKTSDVLSWSEAQVRSWSLITAFQCLQHCSQHSLEPPLHFFKPVSLWKMREQPLTCASDKLSTTLVSFFPGQSPTAD